MNRLLKEHYSTLLFLSFLPLSCRSYLEPMDCEMLMARYWRFFPLFVSYPISCFVLPPFSLQFWVNWGLRMHTRASQMLSSISRSYIRTSSLHPPPRSLSPSTPNLDHHPLLRLNYLATCHLLAYLRPYYCCNCLGPSISYCPFSEFEIGFLCSIGLCCPEATGKSFLAVQRLVICASNFGLWIGTMLR